LARAALGLVWVYQGLVPKLLAPERRELAILQATGFFVGHEYAALRLLGGIEMALGLAILARPAWRWPHAVTLGILPAFALSAFWAVPASFLGPFNPPTLILAMGALALIAWWGSRDAVSARHCRRQPGPDGP